MEGLGAGEGSHAEKSVGGELEGNPPRPVAEAARKRAAVETYARHEAALRRTARRYSLCADDAEDALQRGLEILLRKAPTEDPRELVKWTQTVVKHEAMAVRRDRERILAGPAALVADPAREDWTALLPTSSDGPPEQAERREAIARSREALQALRPHELRALTLLAEGYSYAEIGEITGYSGTKVNRLLAEGRERFRRLISSGEDGSRCTEMGPLLSAFCDGEATAEQALRLREHLRACPGCRATLRAYRAAPAAAGALAPVLPLGRGLLERAHEGIVRLASGGGDGAPASGAGGSGAAAPLNSGGWGGALMKAAALVKAPALCAAAVAGVAGCVAAGLIPMPLAPSAEREAQSGLETGSARLSLPAEGTPAPRDEAPATEDQPEPQRHRRHAQPQKAAPEAGEPAPEAGLVVDYAPPPEPEPVSEPAAAPLPSGGGNPAGEFGP